MRDVNYFFITITRSKEQRDFKLPPLSLPYVFFIKNISIRNSIEILQKN